VTDGGCFRLGTPEASVLPVWRSSKSATLGETTSWSAKCYGTMLCAGTNSGRRTTGRGRHGEGPEPVAASGWALRLPGPWAWPTHIPDPPHRPRPLP